MDYLQKMVAEGGEPLRLRIPSSVGNKIISKEEPLRPDHQEGAEVATAHSSQKELGASRSPTVPLNRNLCDAVVASDGRHRHLGEDIEMTAPVRAAIANDLHAVSLESVRQIVERAPEHPLEKLVRQSIQEELERRVSFHFSPLDEARAENTVVSL